MEIRNIRSFLRVAEMGSFSKAAQELGYAQSTVTAQVQQLESELKCSLFDRNGKRVSLSGAGREFMQYAYQIIQYDSMTLAHFSASGEPRGTLTIGITEPIFASAYVSILQSFQKKYPLVSLKLQTVTAYQAMDLLDKGVFDLIILLDHKSSSPNRITVREAPVEICFFSAAAHPLAEEKEVFLERLLQENFVLPEKGCSYRQTFENELAARGKRLHCQTETGCSPYLLQAVQTQQAVGLLPCFALSEAMAKGTVSPIQVKDYRIRMFLQVIRSSKRQVSLPLKVFLEELSQAVL